MLQKLELRTVGIKPTKIGHVDRATVTSCIDFWVANRHIAFNFFKDKFCLLNVMLFVSKAIFLTETAKVIAFLTKKSVRVLHLNHTPSML